MNVIVNSSTDEYQMGNNEFKKKKKRNGNKFTPVIIVIFIHQFECITNYECYYSSVEIILIFFFILIL